MEAGEKRKKEKSLFNRGKKALYNNISNSSSVENFQSLKCIWWIIDGKDFYQCLYVSFKGQEMSSEKTESTSCKSFLEHIQVAFISWLRFFLF